MVDADVVLALVLVLRAVATVGEPRWAILFIGQVCAVSFAVALQLGLDAVAGVALEAILLTRVPFAVLESVKFVCLSRLKINAFAAAGPD